MSKGVHRNNLLLVRPLWKGANICCGLGVREVRSDAGEFSIDYSITVQLVILVLWGRRLTYDLL